VNIPNRPIRLAQSPVFKSKELCLSHKKYKPARLAFLVVFGSPQFFLLFIWKNLLFLLKLLLKGF
jgi:hypothetical protein